MKKFILLTMLCACSVITYSQKLIQGKISNNSGAGIQGANVYVPSLLSGTESDSAGNFSISIPVNSRPVIQVSHIGYQTLLVPFLDTTHLAIILIESQNEIEEIVITSPEARLPDNHPYSIQVYSRDKLENTGGITLM